MAEANVRLRVDGRDAVNQLNRVNKAAGTLKGTVGKLVGVLAGIQAAKFVFFKTAELETQTRSLKVLTGSLGNAKKIIKELQQFGAVTPFTSSELIETAKRLKAFGFETEKIVDVTKRLGDIAGATGADLGGIATAFGQIQAKGRLQGEELLQLQERGVDLQGTLRKEYDLTAEQFQKALSKGQIGADAVTFALEKLTEKGGKYANGAIAQSDTLAGKFSTIQDGIDRLATAIGTTLEPAIKFVLDLAIQAIGEITTLLGKGAEARNFGLQQKQLDEIDRKARETAGTIGKARGFGGALDPRQMLLQSQIARDMLRQYGFESGQLQLPQEATAARRERPSLGGGTSTSGSTRGGGAGGRATQAVDMSDAMLALQKERLELLLQEDKLGLAIKENQIELLRISEASYESNQRIFQILQANNALDLEKKSIDQEQLDRYNALKEAIQGLGKSVAEDWIKEQDRLAAESGAKLKAMYQQIGDSITNGIVNGITAAVDGTKSLAEVASSTLKQIGGILLQFGVSSIMGSIPGLGGLFGRANGGPAKGGQPYMVGERGPELFVPGQSGGVMRNEDMRSLMGRSPASGGAPSMNFSFETTSIGGTEYVSREQLESAMAVTRKQASNDGAKRGMSMTLDKMQNSPRTRTRIGLR